MCAATGNRPNYHPRPYYFSSNLALNKDIKQLTSRLDRFAAFFVSGTFVCPGITRTRNSSSTSQQIQ